VHSLLSKPQILAAPTIKAQADAAEVASDNARIKDFDVDQVRPLPFFFILERPHL
jgi:hypothetical protein